MSRQSSSRWQPKHSTPMKKAKMIGLRKTSATLSMLSSWATSKAICSQTITYLLSSPIQPNNLFGVKSSPLNLVRLTSWNTSTIIYLHSATSVPLWSTHKDKSTLRFPLSAKAKQLPSSLESALANSSHVLWEVTVFWSSKKTNSRDLTRSFPKLKRFPTTCKRSSSLSRSSRLVTALWF